MTTKTTRQVLMSVSLRVSRFHGPDQFDIDDMLDDPKPPASEDKDDKDDKDDKNKQRQQRPKDEDDKENKGKDDKDKDKKKSEFELNLEDAGDHDDDEEEEEEEEEENEDEKDKGKDKDKNKNDEKTSNGILKKRALDAEKKLEEFGSLTPALAKEFDAFMQTRFNGQIPTEEELRGELALLADKDAEIQRLNDEIATKDQKLSDIDIRNSPEFQKQYAEPYNVAAEGLFLEIANLDSSGKALAMTETNAFFEGLLKLEKLDGVIVKQELTKFAANFERLTGEAYKAPSVAAVMTALRQAREARTTMQDAYTNWSTKKSQAITQRQKDEEENIKQTAARNERVRKSQALEAMRGYDRSELEGFMDDDAFTKSYNEEYQFVESVMKDATKAPPFKELMIRGFKARAFDALLKEFKELKKFKDEHDKKKKNGSRGGGGSDADDKDDSWDDGKLD